MGDETATVPPWKYLELQKTITSFVDAFFQTRGKDADIVWHYTNAAGLIGILESGYLRGTNYAFMNDATEFDYGCDVAHKVLDELQEEDRGRSFYAQMAEELEKFTNGSEIYLACFSELGNDLSQWRGYSSGPDRFSLAMDCAALKKREPHALMQAVEYRRSAQREHIRHFLTESWKIVEGHGSPGLQNAAAAMIVPFLFDILCFYKDEQFAAEKEWRIAKRLSTAELTDVGFLDSPGGLRAFVPLCGTPRRSPLPLVELNFLSAHPERAEKFASMLLRKCGYLNVVTNESGIPFVL